MNEYHLVDSVLSAMAWQTRKRKDLDDQVPNMLPGRQLGLVIVGGSAAAIIVQQTFDTLLGFK